MSRSKIYNQVRKLGTFIHGIIQPSRTIPEALQDLENYAYNLPGALTPVGTWDADTNTPALVNGGTGNNIGDLYVVSVAGATVLDGNGPWTVGDHVFLGNDSLWNKVDNTQLVSSVHGRLGAVTAAAGDYTASEVDFVSPGPELPETNTQGAVNHLNTRSDALVTLSGVAENAANLGTFTGVTIPDSSTIKEALQELETAFESLGSPDPTLTDILYADLVTAIGAGTLSPGAQYRITDYQTVHTIYGTATTNTGPVEPLIVYALTASSISQVAKSQTYPQDIIIYTTANTAEIPGATKGTIRRRIDMNKNIDICFDFRAVKFRRYEVTQPAYNALTEYKLNEIVADAANTQGFGATTLYVSLNENNLGNALSDNTKWLRISFTLFHNGMYWSTVNNGAMNLLGGSTRPAEITSSANFQDFYVINDLTYTRNVFIERPTDNITNIFASRSSIVYYGAMDLSIGRLNNFQESTFGTITSSFNFTSLRAVCGTLNQSNGMTLNSSFSTTIENCSVGLSSSLVPNEVSGCYTSGSFQNSQAIITQLTCYSLKNNIFSPESGLTFTTAYAITGASIFQNNFFRTFVNTASLTTTKLIAAVNTEIYLNDNGDTKIQYRDNTDALVTAVI